MALPTFDYNLESALTFTLTSGIKYIKVSGIFSKILTSIDIIDSGGTCTLFKALESPDYINFNNLEDADCKWFDYQNNGTFIQTISSGVMISAIDAPNVIKVNNTNTGKNIRFNFKGNRA